MRLFGLFVTTPAQKPLVVVSDYDSTADEEYAAICKKVGLHIAPPMTKGKLFLEKVLAEETMGTYDLKAVARYMDKKARGAEPIGFGSRRWAWTPLRKQDLDDTAWKGRDYSGIVNYKCEQFAFGKSYYTKPIPQPVLEMIDRINDRVPHVQFVVADIISLAWPDPFLAVTLPGLEELYVIARWDEPGFRESE